MLHRFLFIGAVSALLSVAIGAFGAHGLEGRIAERMLENYQTGVLYQMLHSVGLLAVGLAGLQSGAWDAKAIGRLKRSGWLMLAGIVLFSGSLYAMALTGWTKLGAITPIGGVCFLAGWAFFGAAALRLQGGHRT